AWLFAGGGRPVIYQSDEEYEALPESLRWRHVRYEPHADPPIDFSWEREWRIRVESLEIHPAISGVVLPGCEWAYRLISEHDEKQNWLVQEYSLIFSRSIAEQYRDEFPWRIFALGSG